MFKGKSGLIALFLAVFIVYTITGPLEATPHDYFVRLAHAFLEGKLYLTDAPSWLNELVPVNGRYYVVYPPMPAIVLAPTVALLRQISQTLISTFFGAANSVLVYLVLGRLKISPPTRLWLTFFFAFGTNHWYLAQTGSAWYFAHVVAVFFLFLAIWETLGKKRAFLVGIFLGAAYLARLPTVLAFPFFLIMLVPWGKSKKTLPVVFQFLAGLAPFVAGNALYNWARFKVFYDIGYRLIPGVIDEPDFRHGILHPANIGKQLRVMFLKLPLFRPSPPYLLPSHEGMALWITSPALIFSLAAPLKERLVRASWLTIPLLALPSLLHATVGYSQFGYRRAMDFMPFLVLLTARGIGNEIRWYHKALIIASILVNLWGVILIQKFGLITW